MRILETELFQYEELSEEAKKRALPQIRDSQYVSSSVEWAMRDVEEDFTEFLHRIELNSPRVFYSVSYSQGDGACFETKPTYQIRRLLRAARKYLSGESKKLMRKWRKYRFDVSVEFSHHGHYYHEKSVNVNVELQSYSNAELNLLALERDLTQWFEDTCRALYRRLCDCVEYYWDDSALIEEAVAAEMEFSADGRLYEGD